MNDDLRNTYNRIAVDWHNDHTTDDWWVAGTDHFLSLLPPSGTVLDVGCGAGTKSRYIADRGFRVTGVDFSEGVIAIARRELPGIEFNILAMEDLDTVQVQYDGVFAQASLLHIPRNNTSAIVAKMTARVADGGYLYIAVKEAKDNSPLEEVKMEQDYGYEYQRFFSYYRLEELESLLTSAGCEVVWKDRKPAGRTVWLQIIGRK